MERILICGDSFAADWTKKYSGEGWPNLLEKHYQVTNLAQAGCSEYKIWLQLESQIDQLDHYDHVIISHTSPYRIYVKTHPVHSKDPLHHSSDLIYLDIVDKQQSNPNIDLIVEWFEKYFDLDHARFIHELLCKKIDQELSARGVDALHITNLDWSDLYQFDDILNFEHLFEKHRGLMNHYDQVGNNQIFNAVRGKLLGKQ
jgi:hypothetical protein